MPPECHESASARCQIGTAATAAAAAAVVFISAVGQITHRPRKTRSDAGRHSDSFLHPAGAASRQKPAEEVMQTGVSSCY